MEDYISVTIPTDTSVKLSSTMNEEAPADAREYAGIVGGLMFAACVTRRDIMCAVGQLSQFLNNPSSKAHVRRQTSCPLSSGDFHSRHYLPSSSSAPSRLFGWRLGRQHIYTKVHNQLHCHAQQG